MAQSEKEQDDYRITYYNAVSSKTVDWLWYPYIPYGKITILQGDPGAVSYTHLTLPTKLEV